MMANDIIKKTHKALGKVIDEINSIEDGAEVSANSRNAITELTNVIDDTKFGKVLSNISKIMKARLVTLALGKG
jgi:hypothetical protein